MQTLLIANRGEVVVRIARSARAMGWRTVAVHADTDSGTPYLSSCDQVIGIGGDTAAEEATYLSKICSEVHLIVRRDEMRASKIMQERVLNTPNITVHWNSAPVQVLGTDGVEGVKLQDTKTGEERTLEITGFFVAIGHKPNTDVFRGWLTLDDTGYIVTQPGRSFTNIPGVFACGDVQDRIYRQAVTAAGSGCMAALDAERYLVEHGM